ncbi:MAG TPA: alpha/beta fold hydrolase, partial [Dehalococcoidia bacterium]|nr:alpha/beta fold hydrolase [Dehalococcoidia bacterium]
MSVTKVSIGVASQVMAGTLHRPAIAEDPAPAMLLIHGWDGSEEDLADAAEALCHLGCLALTFNFRGHNRKDPQFDEVSREDGLVDVLAAYDFLIAQEGVDPARVGVVGFSYGGYLGVLLSARRPLRWLALRAPALYLDRDFDKPKKQLSTIHDLATFRQPPLDPEDNTALT